MSVVLDDLTLPTSVNAAIFMAGHEDTAALWGGVSDAEFVQGIVCRPRLWKMTPSEQRVHRGQSKALASWARIAAGSRNTPAATSLILVHGALLVRAGRTLRYRTCTGAMPAAQVRVVDAA
jgi:hypothetical protein